MIRSIVFTTTVLSLIVGCVLEENRVVAVDREATNDNCTGGCCDPKCNLQSTHLVDRLTFLDLLTLHPLALPTPVPSTYQLNVKHTESMHNDADGRNVLRHLVSCALNDGDTVLWHNDSRTKEGEWYGYHGIVPEWTDVTWGQENNDSTGGDKSTTNPMSLDIRKRLSNCMLSYINDNDTSVKIETSADDFGPDPSRGFTLQGGAFMGFVMTLRDEAPEGQPHFWSCYSLPRRLKDKLGGNDEDTRDCPYTNSNCGVQSLGFCGEVCTTQKGLYGGWGECENPDFQLGVGVHPANVHLATDDSVETYVCQTSPAVPCNKMSGTGAHERLIAHAPPGLATPTTFVCDEGDDCAFYVDGDADAMIEARDGADMAVTCNATSGQCDVRCTDEIFNGAGDTFCQITMPKDSAAGIIQCENEATCRLTCLEKNDASPCRFARCDHPAGEQRCPGYPNSKFCGECPGTCAGADPGTSDLACDATGPVSGRSCQCDRGCSERGDCCENKFAICGGEWN